MSIVHEWAGGRVPLYDVRFDGEWSGGKERFLLRPFETGTTIRVPRVLAQVSASVGAAQELNVLWTDGLEKVRSQLRRLSLRLSPELYPEKFARWRALAETLEHPLRRLSLEGTAVLPSVNLEEKYGDLTGGISSVRLPPSSSQGQDAILQWIGSP